MLSNTCKYAVRACIYLAIYGEEKLLNIKDIAKGLEVPEPFLGKIMQVLAKKKILYSQRGISGGFKFLKNPNDIKILDIVEIIDGLDSFNQCLLGVRVCSSTPEYTEKCPFHTKLDPILHSMKKVLGETSIGEYAKRISDFSELVLI